MKRNMPFKDPNLIFAKTGFYLNTTELTLYFPMFPFDPPENIRKPKVF